MALPDPSRYQIPGLLRRIGSLVYELLLLAALLLAASALSTPLMAQFGRTPLSTALNGLYLIVVMFGYFGLCWVRTGQTVAMKAWCLHLQSLAGEKIGWPLALRRFFIAGVLYVAIPLLAYRQLAPLVGSVADRILLSLLWWLLPLGWAWFDPHKQFLHDRLSGTRQWYLPRPPRPGKIKSR